MSLEQHVILSPTIPQALSVAHNSLRAGYNALTHCSPYSWQAPPIWLAEGRPSRGRGGNGRLAGWRMKARPQIVDSRLRSIGVRVARCLIDMHRCPASLPQCGIHIAVPGAEDFVGSVNLPPRTMDCSLLDGSTYFSHSASAWERLETGVRQTV